MNLSKIPSSVRKAVYARDGYACALCQDARSIHVHHIRKRSLGGGHSRDNLICLCPLCHAVVHGEVVLERAFPFDSDVAAAAIQYYMSLVEPP